MSEGAPTEVSEETQTQIEPVETELFNDASILIVDEDPAFQLGLKTFLKEYVGFAETFTANNGEEALELLEKEPSITMVTLDYKMPDVNGIEFLETLKDKLPRPLAIIMITGYPSEELEETFHAFDSHELRAKEFVHKPVEFTALEAILHRSWEDLQTDSEPPPEPSEEISTDLPRESPEVALDWRLIQIEQKIDHLSAELATVKKRLPNPARQFWGSIFRAIIIVTLFWLAFHFGWLQQLSHALNSFRY